MLPRPLALGALALGALSPLSFLACTSSSTPAASTAADAGAPSSPLPEACDPIVPSHCGFPMPSNLWTVADATTKTGLRVRFDAEMLPRPAGRKTDPAPFAKLDGFSTGMTLMTHLPGATATGLPSHVDLAASVAPGAKTIVLDAETGELVPHWSELDVKARTEDDQTFMVRPAVRLKDAHRYLVGIRHVVDASGAELAPSPAFAALRDGTPFAHPSIDARRALYAEIFTQLESAGFARGELQLAWDFTTASRERTTAALVAMRDEALAAVGPKGPEYTVAEERPDPDPDTHVTYVLQMKVPLYLDKAEPGGTLVRGADGRPKQNGWAEFPVVVHVPKSAMAEGAAPAALVQNGHGLLGSRNEGDGGYLTMIGNAKNYVTFSVDFVGMAHDDVSTFLDAMGGDIGHFDAVVGRQHQGLVNSLLAMRMMKGRFAEDQAKALGRPLVDPTLCFYRGDSQGGIFGGTYVAISTDVTRGLLSVPGAPYSILLNRSEDFGPFFTLLGAVYPSALDLQLTIGFAQMLWDETEPNGYIASMTDAPLPGTPPHHVLIQSALGDHQVGELGAHYLARAVKATLVTPAVRPIHGLVERAAPFAGSAIVELDYGNPPDPIEDRPPTGGEDPHEKVRRQKEAYDQADVFFRTGEVVQTCAGACVFE